MPQLYWLPLTDAEVEAKRVQKELDQKEVGTSLVCVCVGVFVCGVVWVCVDRIAMCGTM